MVCELASTSAAYTPQAWLYSNDIMADPTVCGYLVSITNAGSAANMITVIRTGAELLKTSVAMISGLVAVLYMSNL